MLLLVIKQWQSSDTFGQQYATPWVLINVFFITALTFYLLPMTGHHIAEMFCFNSLHEHTAYTILEVIFIQLHNFVLTYKVFSNLISFDIALFVVPFIGITME